MTTIKRKQEEGSFFSRSKPTCQRASATSGTNLCEKCRSMTSTKEGLWALLIEGYEHYIANELECSAQYGCLLCRIIHEQLQRTPSRRTNKPTRLFANLGEQSYSLGLSSRANSRLGHPFAGNPLKYIGIFGEADDWFTLNATTSSGEYLSPCTVSNYTDEKLSS
jgi:hypothetical protein